MIWCIYNGIIYVRVYWIYMIHDCASCNAILQYIGRKRNIDTCILLCVICYMYTWSALSFLACLTPTCMWKARGQTHVHTIHSLYRPRTREAPVLRTYLVIPVVFIFDVCKWKLSIKRCDLVFLPFIPDIALLHLWGWWLFASNTRLLYCSPKNRLPWFPCFTRT